MKRLFSKFKCNILGWHKPINKIKYLGGDNFKSTCKYCGREILRDSTGSWFSVARNVDFDNDPYKD